MKDRSRLGDNGSSGNEPKCGWFESTLAIIALRSRSSSKCGARSICRNERNAPNGGPSLGDRAALALRPNWTRDPGQVRSQKPSQSQAFNRCRDSFSLKCPPDASGVTDRLAGRLRLEHKPRGTRQRQQPSKGLRLRFQSGTRAAAKMWQREKEPQT